MADTTMERSLAAAIESSAAAAAGTLSFIWLVPLQYQHHRRDDDEVQHATGDNVVASQSQIDDDFIPRDSDLDERILALPPIHRTLLLAVASLQQEDVMVIDMQVTSQQLLEAGGSEAYRNGGFGAVPAAAAAVASLGKRTFHNAGGDHDDGFSGDHHHQSCCSICLEDFEDGEEMGVMPCPGGHEFHSNCIAKWLGQSSNMCPLCRHALPTAVDDR